MFHKVVCLAFAAMLLGLTPGQASPIEYIFDGVGSGTYGETQSGTDPSTGAPIYTGGTAFTNSGFSVVVTGDTTNIVGAGTGFVTNTAPATVSIGSFFANFSPDIRVGSVYDITSPPDTSLANVGFGSESATSCFLRRRGFIQSSFPKLRFRTARLDRRFAKLHHPDLWYRRGLPNVRQCVVDDVRGPQPEFGGPRTLHLGDDDPKDFRRRLHGLSAEAERSGASHHPNCRPYAKRRDDHLRWLETVSFHARALLSSRRPTAIVSQLG